MLNSHWIEVRDGDVRLRPFFERHYSARPKKARHYKNWRRICAPGEHMILITSGCDALLVWTKEKIRRDGQTGINCSVFRNESIILSSKLIAEAVELAWQKWPQERLFTYVNPTKIKSTNPGYCFLQAGWKRLNGTSPKGLIILEILPNSVEEKGYNIMPGPKHNGSAKGPTPKSTIAPAIFQ